MHVPDGFIDAPTSLAAGVAAAAGLSVASRRAADALGERQLPLAGLTAAFVFALQMLNFPVASGTSGHLVGGALAAILVGPWVAVLCMTVVIGVQALVFADGGLSALGINIVLMGFASCFLGAGAFHLVRRVLPESPTATVAASMAAAWVGVVGTALGFVGFYALGGTADISLTALTTAMVGVHSLIGIGEAAITGMTVSAVLGTRPDLVHALTPARSSSIL